MSKIKRIAALLLALVMVMGMSVTSFADETKTTITVTNVDAGSTVTYEQIIVPAPGEVTGWAFTESTAAESFKSVIKGDTKKDDQQIIAGLIVFTDQRAKLPEELKANAAKVDATILQKAFNIAALANTATNKDTAGNYLIPAETAGVYVIHATDTKEYGDTEDPSKVTKWINYSPMAAYVSFGYTDGGAASTLNPVTVNAKKQDLTLTKEDNEADKVTAVGDVVTYTIKTSVPYIPDDVTADNVYFNVTDAIKGAQYVSNRISVNNGPAPEGMLLAEKAEDVVAVTVKLGVGTPEEREAKLVAVPNGLGYEYSFVLDLKDIAGAVDQSTGKRLNANQSLEITYKAYVKSVVVDNKAYTEVKTKNDQDSPDKGPEDNDKIYTGSLKITKHNADNEDEVLADAKFVLYYTVGTGANAKKVYAVTRKTTQSDTDVDGADYIVTGWSEDKPNKENDDVLLITKADGTVTIKGLEDDTDREYFFEEVVAPSGYSLNSEPAKINSWKDNKRNDAETANDRIGFADLSDTKLSSLPSTGGIGTTIFTIGGCLIMIVAAGLFFATRKKSAK